MKVAFVICFGQTLPTWKTEDQVIDHLNAVRASYSVKTLLNNLIIETDLILLLVVIKLQWVVTTGVTKSNA